MKILSQSAVSTAKRTQEVEAIERIAKIRAEEAKICKSFSLLKQEVADKKAAMLEDYRLSMESLSKQRTALLSEVTNLESRKREAERPVDLKMKELSLLSAKAAADLAKSESLKAEALETREQADALMDDLSELKELLTLKELDLKDQELSLQREQERLQKSNQKLSAKWLEYHEKVTEMNTELSRKRFEVEALAKANQVFKESLDAVSAQHVNEKRAIRDGYESLERAKREILGRKA